MKYARLVASLVMSTVLILTNPIFAGHNGEPKYRGHKPVMERKFVDFCDTQRQNYFEEEDYDMFPPKNGNADTFVYYLNSEKNPVAIHVDGSKYVWYDLDRDGHMDGKDKIEGKIVGENPCDIIPHLKKKKGK